MKNIEEIKIIINGHKTDLKNEFEITTIGVFGSYSKENQKKTSDIDILVEFQEAIDLFKFIHLKNYLSELLNINVDLVMKSALKPNIGKRILKKVVYF